MIFNKTHISEIIGGRLDVKFYNPQYIQIIKSITSVSYCCLNDVATFSNESWNQEDYFETTFPYIEIGAVDTITGEILNIATVEKKKAPSRAKKIARRNDIIVSTTRPNRGAISMINGDMYIVSTGFSIIRDISNCILRDYLFIVLRLHSSLEQMMQRSSGGNYPAITEEELKKILIPLPPIKVQQQIVDIYTSAQKAKQVKEQKAQKLLDSIDNFLIDILDVKEVSVNYLQQSIFTHIRDLIGQRLDVSSYKKHFELISSKYENKKLSAVVEITPPVKFNGLSDGTSISFVPMECINEKYGEIKDIRETTVSNAKGFTKFKEGDLLWAKITPCMQNGKSAIARNLINGIGCGSTEFYVMRPKDNSILIDFVYLLLRHKKVLIAAQTSFGGAAGQQRVSNQYLKSVIIPHPPIEIQHKIISEVENMKKQAKQLELEGSFLIESAKKQIEKMILG